MLGGNVLAFPAAGVKIMANEAQRARADIFGLEPQAIFELVSKTPFEGEIAHSIAISLKRIADTLENVTACDHNGFQFLRIK